MKWTKYLAKEAGEDKEKLDGRHLGVGLLVENVFPDFQFSIKSLVLIFYRKFKKYVQMLEV